MTKRELDDIDFALLRALDEDSRCSLKKLADASKFKTSTIYHRLQQLMSTRVILGFSLILNPEGLVLDSLHLVKVSLKAAMGLDLGIFNKTFVENLAKFLAEQFPEVLFAVLEGEKDGETNKRPSIILIVAHPTKKDEESFYSNLRANPYVDSVEITPLGTIVVGDRIFRYNEKFFRRQKPQEKNAEEVEGLGIEELERKLEVEGDILDADLESDVGLDD
ncbi:MAG: hypothetical protein Kow0069_33810 [Promethearchaeota archaeon]